jgi:hypothetical protein
MQVSAAMPADAVTVANGKPDIQGGGWTSVIARHIPTVHPALALTLIFRPEWHEANENLQFVIELVDEDGRQAGVRATMGLRVAPTPYAQEGGELYQSAAHMLYGLRFEKYGTFRFQVIQQWPDFDIRAANRHTATHDYGMTSAPVRCVRR